LATTAFAARDWFRALRRPEQQSFLDALVTPPEKAPDQERHRTAFDLALGEPPDACVVATLLIGERSGTVTPTKPHRIAADSEAVEPTRALARLLGGRDETWTAVSAALLTDARRWLVQTGQATAEPCCHIGLALPWRTDVAAVWPGASGPRSWQHPRDD
jgi:hypothetical protein